MARWVGGTMAWSVDLEAHRDHMPPAPGRELEADRDGERGWHEEKAELALFGGTGDGLEQVLPVASCGERSCNYVHHPGE
jgi:hypothetical protein